MTFWILLWKAFLIGTVAVFAVMAVIVSIGGAFDIRKLIERLGKADSEEE